MTTTLELCIDCTHYASGISPEERGEPYPDAVIEAFADPARSLNDITPGTTEHGEPCYYLGEELMMSDDCECEEIAFTWSRCDGCLSPLGGSRQLFTLHY